MPTIIDELTMTLTLDPGGWKDGADAAKTSAAQLLRAMLEALKAIEAKTRETADNTARIRREADARAAAETAAAAARSQAAAEKTATNETALARRAEKEKSDAERRAVEERRKSGLQMEDSFSRVGASIKKAGLELLAFMGISLSVAAAENLFMNLNKTNREAGLLATNIGLDVETLSIWANTASRFQVSAETITNAFTKMKDEEMKYRISGQSNMPAAFRDLFNINVEKTPNGAWYSQPELVMKMRERARQMGWSPEMTRGFLDQAGYGELAPLVNAPPGELEAGLALTRRTGDYTSNDAARQSTKFGKDMNEAEKNLRGLARMIQEQLTPDLDALLVKFNSLMDANRGTIANNIVQWLRDAGNALIKFYEDFNKFIGSEGFKTFEADVTALAKRADEAAQAVGGWGKMIEYVAEIWLGAKVLGMMGRMGSMIGLAVGLARALGMLNPIGAFLWGTAAAGVAEIKSGMTDAYALQLGFAPSMTAPLSEGGHPTQYTRGGKTYDRFEVEAEIKARMPELKDIQDKMDAAAKAQSEAAQAQSDAADAQRKAAEEQKKANDRAIEQEILQNAPGMPGPRPGSPRTDAGLPGFGEGGKSANTAVAMSLSAPMRAFLDTLAGPESHGDYAAVGPGHHMGRYQFGDDLSQDRTWAEVSAQTGLRAWTAENQDLNAAWLIRDTYRKQTGRDFDTDINDPARLPGILAALGGRWPSLPGAPQSRRRSRADFEDTMRNRLRVLQGGMRPDPWDVPDTAPAAPSAHPARSGPVFPMMFPEQGELGASLAAGRMHIAAMSLDHSRSSETHIAQITIHTQATDAAGIARDIKGQLRRFDYVAQADAGLV